MKYERTEAFKRDYRNLAEDEKQIFREVVRAEFHPALEERSTNPGAVWPPKLRIKGVEGAAGIWEMTWNFTDPDGRATWEWTKVDNDTAIRWRRIGPHRIFKDP